MTPSQESDSDARWRKIDRNMKWAIRCSVVSIVCLSVALAINVLRLVGVLP